MSAYRWVENHLDQKKKGLAAIVELARSKGLVVSKLDPSGVATHLIGGTTVQNVFAVDIECNSEKQG